MLIKFTSVNDYYLKKLIKYISLKSRCKHILFLFISLYFYKSIYLFIYLFNSAFTLSNNDDHILYELQHLQSHSC